MSLHTLTTPAISKKSETKLFVAPLLNRIKKESKKEFVEMQQTFELMGWGELPDSVRQRIFWHPVGVMTFATAIFASVFVRPICRYRFC